MNLNDDLAARGEPPASSDEQAEAERLARLLERLERGETLESLMLPPLDLDLTALYRTTGLFRRDTGLLSAPDTDLAGGDAYATLPSEYGSALPNPFPGEFQVQRLLGQGAFGKVWLAEDLCLRRLVALKTLQVSGSVRGREQKLAALQKEASILAQFSHPNIVQVYAWRQSGPDHYLVLHYVAGGAFDKRLKDGPLPWHLAARYVADVAHGLLVVHRQGVIHRDIKPANILWRYDEDHDEALLTDFGVSAHLSDGKSVGGTPLYMAPEAFAGQVSPKLDVYSLAATLFHLATGAVPFQAETTEELVTLIGRGLPTQDPRYEGLPQPLEQVIRSGLDADPRRRPDLRAFLDALRGTLNQVLADSLVLPAAARPGQPPVNLRLTVSRQVGPGRFQEVAAKQTSAGPLLRNMKKVPPEPAQVGLRTGDRVRIEVVADRSGYVTVFNVGPTGDLNLLFPDEPPTAATPPTIQAGVTLNVIDVQMEPPAGRERLFVVWTRRPLPLQPQQLQGIIDQGEMAAAGPYQATRNMVRVKQSVQQLPPDEWHAVVLELDHQE